MSCTTTSDKTCGFKQTKPETEFTKDFFKNIHPDKITQFRQIVLNKQLHGALNNKKNNLLNQNKQNSKKKFAKKIKISKTKRNKIDKVSELDTYRVYAYQEFLKNHH